MAFFWIIFILGVFSCCYAVIYLFPEPFFDFALRAQYKQAGLKKQSIQVDDHEISYLVGGQGPPLLLLHGFGADKHHWPQVVKRLTKYFTVYAPDIPGFGESSQVASASYVPDKQIQRIRAFVDSLGLKNIHLGGNSMGGYFAGLYAAQHADTVASLWLLAPAGVLGAERTPAIEKLESGTNPLLVDNMQAYDELTSLCFYKAPYIPAPFRRCICVRAMTNHDFNQKLFADLRHELLPLEELLANSSIPTLIVWGEHDQLLHPSGAALLGEHMAQAKVKIMPAMGHIPMLERPTETENLYLEFHQLGA